MTTRGATLYVVGDSPGVTYYDTTVSPPTWTWLGGYASGQIPDSTLKAIAITGDGTIYVGGVDTTNNAFFRKWDGSSTWVPVTGAATNVGGTSAIWALTAYGNDLYVGGNFTTVGGSITVRGLAKLSGSTWSAVGGTPPWKPCGTGGSTVRAIAWNGSGELCVTGYLPNSIDTSTQNHFFLLINGTWASVPATGLSKSGTPSGYALAVDRFAGKVYVGGDFDSAGGVTGTHNVAVWYDFIPYTIVDLGTLSANTYAYGFGVNKNGLATGYSQALVGGSTRDHCFKCTSFDDLTDQGVNGPWGANDNTYAYGINDSSIFVGVADQNGSGTLIRGFRNFLPGTWTLLNPINASYSSRALALNNGGVAVGYSGNDSGVNRATRWPNGSAAPTDLHTLISQDLQSYASYAYGINNNGYIVGKANYPNGSGFQAFICQPNGSINDNTANQLGSMAGL